MNVLVINTGSSSIKFQLFDMTQHRVLIGGLLDRIGEGESCLFHSRRDNSGRKLHQESCRPVADHREGLVWIVEDLKAAGFIASTDDLKAIGHRVVHGGEAFHEPVVIDNEVIGVIREMAPLAPLHNPSNLIGIQVSQSVFPGVPQVAVFDTAFHQTMPPKAFRYALPQKVYREHRVRRYGFHGTSHQFVAKAAAQFLGKQLESLNLITLHLGNGCSATAIAAGKSVDTSMGMTPLEGLLMGTRCGDLDPAIPFYLEREMGLGPREVEEMLNNESGLKGVCRVSDMREVHQHAVDGDESAGLALEMFAYRIKKYIGAYSAVLGRVDGIVFTGGIGENDDVIRWMSCEGLEHLGVVLDPERNRSGNAEIDVISSQESEVRVLKVMTNEELEIARSALALISGGAVG